MEIPNKKELHQVAINHSTDIDFENSGNLQYFTKDVLEWIQKLIMTNDDRIRDEKLQCDINKEPAKISALL